jgi:aspartyl-tRNA(Asn)/glutamyl-tRNA(Gln) amidotransferase subunit C
MTISPEEVERIAKLTRLEFNDSEKQKFQHDLSSILNYVDQLKQLKIDDAPDIPADPDAVNLMRNDVAEPHLSPEDFLEQAPARSGNFVKVKSILE